MPKRSSQEGAWMVGTDSVCQWYMNMASDSAPYFSVWTKQPKVLKFSYDGDSKEDGEEMLRSNLTPAQENGMDNVLVIRLHKHFDPKQGITDRSSYWASTDFRLCPLDEYTPEMGYVGSGSLAALNARIKALEVGGTSEDSGGIMGSIKNLIDSEPIQQVLAGVLAGIASKLIPGVAGQTVATQLAINGIKDEGVSQECYQALLTLESMNPKIEEDLQLLAKLAKENPAMFNQMLTMLRGMYGKA